MVAVGMWGQAYEEAREASVSWSFSMGCAPRGSVVGEAVAWDKAQPRGWWKRVEDWRLQLEGEWGVMAQGAFRAKFGGQKIGHLRSTKKDNRSKTKIGHLRSKYSLTTIFNEFQSLQSLLY